MLSPLNATLSALQAFGQKLGITAGNIANVNTDGFKKSKGTLHEGPEGTVEVSERRIDTPGIPLDISGEGEPRGRESSNVALEEEIPEVITTVYGFKANLKTIKAEDEMLGHLLDTIA